MFRTKTLFHRWFARCGPAGAGLEPLSGDAHLLAEAVCSGRRSDGRGELPGAAVLPGNLHPDHTGTSAPLADKALRAASKRHVTLTSDPCVTAVGPLHDGHRLVGLQLQRSRCRRLLPLLHVRRRS